MMKAILCWFKGHDFGRYDKDVVAYRHRYCSRCGADWWTVFGR